MTHPMRYLPVKSQKPFRGTLLNRSHPLARGLFAAWIFNEGGGDKVFDYAGVNHGEVKNIATGYMADTVGPVLDFDNTGNTDTSHVDLNYMDVPPNTTQMTILISLYIDQFWGDYNDNRLVAKQASTSEADHYWMLGTIDSDIGSADPCQIRSRIKIGGTTYTNVTSNDGNGKVVSSGVWQQVGVVYTGNGTSDDSFRYYHNAVKYAQFYSQSVSGAVNRSSSINSFIGNGDAGIGEFYGALDGRIEYVYMWARALSTEEVALIYREPYAMFR